MDLSEFLAKEANLHAREELFNHRLMFDLKLAAFAAGYHLQTFYSDVDHDGFDVVFDDREVIRKVQLKTVSATATTSSWDIHRHILRPRPDHMNEFGFGSSDPYGVEGGVILIEYKVPDGMNAVEVTYWYTELSLVAAISLGLVARGSPTTTAAENLRRELIKKDEGETPGKIGVAKGLFTRAASPQNVLCLLGLAGTINRNWAGRVAALGREKWGAKGVMLATKLQEYRNEFPAVMKEVCGHERP
jgi:hypothetical protein